MRSGPGQKRPKTKKKQKNYSGQQQKEMDCDGPHLAPNEKTQPIQWTERSTGALVAASSLCPKLGTWLLVLNYQAFAGTVGRCQFPSTENRCHPNTYAKLHFHKIS